LSFKDFSIILTYMPTDLFSVNLTKNSPLPDRLRPHDLADFYGQEEVVGEESLLKKAIASDNLPSMIFWGPPGCGKTTLAKIIANLTKSFFVDFSAVSGTVKDVREIIAKAVDRQKFQQQRTVLFVDEIHRFNKAQQDAFLPAVEKGVIILIGATTENPSFTITAPLMSRCRLVVLKSLSVPAVEKILKRAVESSVGFGGRVTIEEEDVKRLANLSSGDARTALNALDFAVQTTKAGKDGIIKLNAEVLTAALQKSRLLYDRAGEEHYNLISALHKSMRGSDINAALYWLERMLAGGEEPLYIARRLIRFASEDVGLAQANGLTMAVSAYQACHFIGMPECSLALSQVVAFLAKAPKSNALYRASLAIRQDIKTLPAYGVPLHLRNAESDLMKGIGYGKGYKYNPDYEGPVDQYYLPEELKDRKYFSD
jgi:putative ATPase